jgi:DNA polymerase III epsilon subunit-like protein
MLDTKFVNTAPESIMYENWRELTVCIWDCETTGLNIYGDDFRIVQFCGKIYKGSKQIKSMNVLINPELPIPEGASKVHNIYDKDVVDAPTFGDIFDELNIFLHAAQVHCAFNGLGYDVDAMISEYQRVGREYVGRPMIDLLVWERQRTGKIKFGGNKLADVAKRRGCAIMGKVLRGDEMKLHDAQTDVMILHSVLEAYSEDLPYALGRLLDLQTEYKIKQDAYALKTFGDK